ncbi:MAG: hypothetical protein ACI30I_11610 [Parabacteroides sp.]
MKTSIFSTLAGICMFLLTTQIHAQEATPAHVDAYRLGQEAVPSISQVNDSVYTIHDWYGIKGYDLHFVVTSYGDSTIIDLIDAGPISNGFYYVETGLAYLPIAGVSPGFFEPSKTILSGFHGNGHKGHVWSYVYLYTPEKKWQGGHLYKMMWGQEPEKPLWSVKGRCTLVGNVAGIETRLECYAGNRYILRDWYGAEKYDLEFQVRPDGGLDILDYYWEENGERFVQCRRTDIAFAKIPQTDEPNGAIEGDAQSGRLHFRMTAFEDDDKPCPDPEHPEYLFEW